MPKHRKDVLAKKLLPIILKQVKQAMRQVVQWQDVREIEWRQNSCQYMVRLGALVEVLEIADCGSVGGYGEGQFECNETHDTDVGDLFDRANWLINKYK